MFLHFGYETKFPYSKNRNLCRSKFKDSCFEPYRLKAFLGNIREHELEGTDPFENNL